MVMINPLVFFLYASELALRIGKILDRTNILPMVMIIFSILVAIYFVITLRFDIPSTVSDGGLMFSVFIAWFFTISSLDLFLFYFTTAATAFLCILYGFWIDRREWRILGILIIASSLGISAILIASIGETIQIILSF